MKNKKTAIFASVLVLLAVAALLFTMALPIRTYVTQVTEKPQYKEEYRAPAEFDRMQGLIIFWFWSERFWEEDPEKYKPVLLEIVREAKTEAVVYIVTDNGWEVKNYLAANNVIDLEASLEKENICFVYYTGLPEKIWVRDYGPFWGEDAGRIIMFDLGYKKIDGSENHTYPYYPKANSFPRLFLNYFDDPRISGGSDISGYEQMPVIMDGGNLMTNGDGLIICPDTIFEENCSFTDSIYTEEELEDVMQNVFGDRLIIINKGPGQHIDINCKFINNNTIFVGEGTQESQQIHENYSDLEENVEILKEIDNRGKSLRIVRIPLHHPEGSPGEPYSYLNSLIINRKVLVPTYGVPEDVQALAIYRDQMPGYQIVGIDCSSLLGTGGVIHCLTREIPAPRDPKAPRALWPAGKIYDKQPMFQWAKAPGVLDYRIRIKMGDRIVVDEEVSLYIGEEPSYELSTQELSGGIYTWKVGAIHQGTTKSGYKITFTKWSDPLTFKVAQYAYDKYGDELLDKKVEPITSQEIMKEEQKFYQPQPPL